MRPSFIYFLFFLAGISGIGNAQHIRGKVTDLTGRPIDGVAVILQTMDSVYMEAAVTDTFGVFRFLHAKGADSLFTAGSAAQSASYVLLFQHLLYQPFRKEIGSPEAGVICLREKTHTLGEVTVKGERPQVSVEGNKLSYDVRNRMKDKTAANAYEVLKELPGISGDEESLELAGASRLQVILNGQLTTLSLEQVIRLLKSMPASRVQKAEIMYNAPAKYNIKGAVINLVLDKLVSEKPAVQGEAGIEYEQAHYANGNAHANLVYAASGFNLDIVLNAGKGRFFNGEEMLARHTLAGQGITEIDQLGRGRNFRQEGSMRIGMEYVWANKDKLSASYYINGDKSRSTHTAWTEYKTDPLNYASNSFRTGHSRSALHNFRVQYDHHASWTVGADYTHYYTPADQLFSDTYILQIDTTPAMLNHTRQEISRVAFFIHHTLCFPTGWTLTYGVHAGYTSSRNGMEYAYDRGDGFEPDQEATEENRQEEYNAAIFGEVSRKFGKHLSATVALKGDYFKSDYESPKENKTLWEDYTLYPTVSLSYLFSPAHILQLNVNSDKTYPSYWNVSPQKTPLNSYSVVEGNPFLKPYPSYEGQLVYIFRQKYIFLGFATYTPDYFVQLPYQSDTELKNVFRFENMDYKLEYGLAMIIPFRIGKWWNSRMTLRGWRMQEKNDHFHSMSYNRATTVGMAMMNNTFNLSDRPNLKLTVDGQYVTSGAIQGIYNLGSFYQVSAGLKWTFAKERASIALTAKDIFRSGLPTAEINEGTQWNRVVKLNDNRSVRLSFVWKFGGYKEKKHEKIDTSRFGK